MSGREQAAEHAGTKPEPGCVQYASCAPGDHTYSWPCALAVYPPADSP